MPRIAGTRSAGGSVARSTAMSSSGCSADDLRVRPRSVGERHLDGGRVGHDVEAGEDGAVEGDHDAAAQPAVRSRAHCSSPAPSSGPGRATAERPGRRPPNGPAAVSLTPRPRRPSRRHPAVSAAVARETARRTGGRRSGRRPRRRRTAHPSGDARTASGGGPTSAASPVLVGVPEPSRRPRDAIRNRSSGQGAARRGSLALFRADARWRPTRHTRATPSASRLWPVLVAYVHAR